MSKRLYWREAPPPPEPIGSATHPLKGIIAQRVGWRDGSCREDSLIVELGEFESFLEGYAAGSGDEEVTEFLADLRKHGKLEIWIDE